MRRLALLFVLALACTGKAEAPAPESRTAPSRPLGVQDVPAPSIGDVPGTKVVMAGCVEAWLPEPVEHREMHGEGASGEVFIASYGAQELNRQIVVGQAAPGEWLDSGALSLAAVKELVPRLLKSKGITLLRKRSVRVGRYHGIEYSLVVPGDLWPTSSGAAVAAVAQLYVVGEQVVFVGTAPRPADWSRISDSLRLADDCDPAAPLRPAQKVAPGAVGHAP